MKPLHFLVLGLLSLSLHAAPAEVIVIRHAEKPRDKDDNHLSPAGRERAGRLPEFLKQAALVGISADELKKHLGTLNGTI